jgi:leader peptidase (prepilin peptidase)/N-methyltransferase
MLPGEIAPETLQWMAVAWLLVAGGAVGSFLNVVVYRLPAGMSIVSPGSHCPGCKHRIRWYDNVPVLGWLVLRGRCRDCGTPISFRYPAVEAAVAGLFLLLAWVELFSLGANLPRRPVPVTGGMIASGLTPAESAAIYAYHLLLLGTLLAAALIEYDGHRAMVRLFAPAAVVGVVAAMIWPQLHPVPAWGPAVGWPAGLTDSIFGLAAGGLLGRATRWGIGPRNQSGIYRGPACVGIFLGWQAAVVLSAAMAAIAFVQRPCAPWLPGWLRRFPAVGWLTGLALAWIVFWRRLAG